MSGAGEGAGAGRGGLCGAVWGWRMLVLPWLQTARRHGTCGACWCCRAQCGCSPGQGPTWITVAHLCRCATAPSAINRFWYCCARQLQAVQGTRQEGQARRGRVRVNQYQAAAMPTGWQHATSCHSTRPSARSQRAALLARKPLERAEAGFVEHVAAAQQDLRGAARRSRRRRRGLSARWAPAHSRTGPPGGQAGT